LLFGNRIAGSVGLTLNGTQGVFASNVVGDPAVTFGADLFNTAVSSNVHVGGTTFTDLTVNGAANQLTYKRQTDVPTWTGGATPPALGDGTLNASYVRYGDLITVHISLIWGSSTTPGNGLWAFSLPRESLRNAVGSLHVLDASPVAVYPGAATVAINGSTVGGVVAGFTGAYLGVSTPITWAAGDKLDIQITYTVR
jgi:hypothetical protein